MTTAKKGGAAATPVKGKDKPGFEQSLERLEKIVAEMEQGSLGLEDLLARFEEGQQLLQFCSEKLNEVEKKIEILVKKGGGIATEPFDPGCAASEDGKAGETKEGDAGDGDTLF